MIQISNIIPLELAISVPTKVSSCIDINEIIEESLTNEIY